MKEMLTLFAEWARGCWKACWKALKVFLVALKALLRGLKVFLQAAFDLLLPRTCIICGCRLNLQERHLCLHCLMEMPLTYFWQQPHNPMADRFNDLMQKDIGERKEVYAYAAALFVYRGDAPFKKIPYHINYQGDISAGRYFGEMLGARMRGCAHWSDVDLIIPVPLHRLRRLKRGYNQAEVIAEGLASAMGAPVRTDLLVRRKKTATQTRLNLEEKAANVKGAFEAVAEHVQALMEVEVGAEAVTHVLLVDDVFTTGSTLMACFTALREVFPPGVRISVATLAFVGGA